MKDGLAGIFLRRKSVGLEGASRRTAPEAESAVEKAVGPERACRRMAPEAESAAEKVAVAEDAESAADGVERAGGLERACRRRHRKPRVLRRKRLLLRMLRVLWMALRELMLQRMVRNHLPVWLDHAWGIQSVPGSDDT